jgi:hypothetical protein
VFLHPLSHANPNRERCAKIGAIVMCNTFPISLAFSKRRGYAGRESR